MAKTITFTDNEVTLMYCELDFNRYKLMGLSKALKDKEPELYEETMARLKTFESVLKKLGV